MKNTNKGFANIFLIAIIVVLIGAVGYLVVSKKPLPAPTQTPESLPQITPPTPLIVTTTVTYKPSTDVIDPSDPAGNIHIYTSYKLGIKFKYPRCVVGSNFENGNCVSIGFRNRISNYPPYSVVEKSDGVNIKDNQSSVKIFTKDPNLSLKDGILKLASPFDIQKCFLQIFPSTIQNNIMDEALWFAVAKISVEERSSFESAGQEVDLYRNRVAQYCPKGFNDAHSWFYGSKKFPDRILYIIGQESTQSFDEIVVTPYPENKIWYNTIEFINKE